ncbi:putative Acyltransferase 3 [Acidobacteriia bacterium SbA2]|nr:putative Acyltransferase 3 [Acidobacteriia bacterium SbA2]
MNAAATPLAALDDAKVERAAACPADEITVSDARSNTQRFYHPELDALRFFAFFLVFIHHHFPGTPAQYNPHLGKLVAVSISSVASAGAFGVDIFFALSSYLITELLLREKARSGRVDVGSFYLRRILRIWPLYFFFLALAAGINGFIPNEHVSGKAIAAFLLFSGNWWMMFAGRSVSVINPLWSVSVEEQFYLVWPPLVRRLNEQGMLVASGIMLLVSNLARLAIALAHVQSERYIWFNTLTRLDPIALGIITAVLLRGRSPSLSSIRRALLFLTSLAVLLVAANVLHTRAEVVHLAVALGYPLVAVSSVGFLVSLLASDPPWWARGPLVYLGRISYGLYVFHILALKLADVIGAHASFGSRFVKGEGVLGFVLTLLMAIVSYQVLERPFLRIKERYSHVLSRPGG